MNATAFQSQKKRTSFRSQEPWDSLVTNVGDNDPKLIAVFSRLSFRDVLRCQFTILIHSLMLKYSFLQSKQKETAFQQKNGRQGGVLYNEE